MNNGRLSGKAAKKKAKVLTNYSTGKPRGKGIPSVIYPRKITRGLIVEEAKRDGVRVSNWLIVTALEKIAARRKTQIEKLIPESEFKELQRTRGKA